MLKPWRSQLSGLLFALLCVALTTVGCGETGDQRGLDGPDRNVKGLQPAQQFNATTDDDYALTRCVVSGAAFDSIGDPVMIEYDGREVRFCCNRCVQVFDEDPAKYLALLDTANDSGGQVTHEHGNHNGHDHAGSHRRWPNR